MRLNRYLSRAGLGSRRDVEELILNGKVRVNGNVVSELSTYVTPDIDSVQFDDKPVVLPRFGFWKFYKPRGIVSTMDDTHGRKSVVDFIKENNLTPGTVPTGRLDLESEGLMILTNDGELINILTHPSNEIEKVYRVLVDRRPDENVLKRLRMGIQTPEFFASADKVIRMGPQPADDEYPIRGYWLEITLSEGKKREIREMLRAAGFNVLRLIRIKHGPVESRELKVGQISEIDGGELQNLLELKSKSAL